MGARLKKILPSWRFIVVLLAGIATVIGAYSLAGVEKREGRSPSQIMVVDEEAYFVAEDVREAVSQTVWGRPVRILIYVGTETTEPGVCNDWVTRCLTAFNSHITSESRMVSDAVVVWINPERGFVEMDSGNIPFNRSDVSDERWDLAANLSYLLRTDEITPTNLANSLQILSDADSNAASTPTVDRGILAIIAGLTVMIILALGLSAISQWRGARKRGGSMARLSRRERRRIVAHVRDVYTGASTSLDEMRLIGVSHSKEPAIATRVAQWENRYTDFARTMFSISDDDDLAKLRQAGLLAKLNRQAHIVAEGMVQLKADDAYINRRTEDHPAPAMLASALDSVEKLAVANSDTTLAAMVPGWRRQAERQIGRTARLRDWDDVARQIAINTEAALTAYRLEHSDEFPERESIEDAARIRALDKVKPGRRRNRAPAVDSKALRDILERAKASEDSRRQVRLPISPALIALAAVASIVLGSVIAALSAPRADHIESGILTAPAITPELLGETDPAVAQEIPVEGEGETWVSPDVIVEDRAELFDDETLREGLAKVPFPVPMDVVVLTTDRAVDASHMREAKVAIAEEFEDYWIIADFNDAEKFAYPEKSDEPAERGRIILWFANSGADYGSDESRPYDFRLEGDFFPERSAATPGISNEVLAWNILVAYSNHYRQIDISSSGSTITTGTNSVRTGLIAGAIIFPLIIGLATFGAIPFRRRRQARAWDEEYQTTMSSLTLGHDALKLEMTYVENKFANYPVRSRWENWDQSYLEVLRSTEYGEESNLSHEMLAKRVAKARILRTQAQSLWRIRPILESAPGWAAHWDDEIALIYAAHGEAGDNLATELLRISNGLADGSRKPHDGLRALDTLSEQDGNVAALRCLGRDGDADQIAASGALTLFSNVDEVGTTDNAPTFSFSFHTGAWSVIKAIGRAVFDSDFMPKVVGVGLVLLFAYSPNLSSDKSLAYDDSVEMYEKPAPGLARSVTVVDEAGIIDEEAMQAAFEQMEWGATPDIIALTVPGKCEYDTLENALSLDLNPEALYVRPISPDKVYQRTDTWVLCISPTSIYSRDGGLVDWANWGLYYDFEVAMDEAEGDVDLTEFVIDFLDQNQPVLVQELRTMPDLLSRL